MAERTDLGRLRPARKLDDGRVVFDAHITRAGIFEYQNPDGSTRRELRPESEVFARESLDSFSLIPVTPNHPPVMITSENAKQYMVGSTGEQVLRDDDHVRTTVMVVDARTHEAMEKHPEVSCGYKCDVIERGGVDPKWGKYDAIQTNIRGNHLAVAVPLARAGSTSRVRMDELRMDGVLAGKPVALATLPPVPDSPVLNPGDMMPTETEKALAAQLAAAEQRAATAESTLAAATARADSAEGRIAGLEKDIAGLRSQRTDAAVIAEKDALILKEKTRADAAEQKLIALPAQITAGVKARVHLERNAAKVMGPTYVMDGLDDREIMVEVVSKVHGVAIEKERSNDYARARFDAAIESHTAGTAVLARLSEVALPVQQPSQRVDAQQPVLQSEAWKQPLPSSKLAGKA